MKLDDFKATVKIGDEFRDTYDHGPHIPGNKRCVRVLEILPNGVRAQVLTTINGAPVHRERFTVLSFMTLRSGYVKHNTMKEPK